MRLMVLVSARLNLCMSSRFGRGESFHHDRYRAIHNHVGVSLRYNEYLGMIDNFKAV